MSFRGYPAYKDSGVEWLGEVPQSWRIVPLLAVADERTDTNVGMKERNLLSLSYGHIVRKDINANDGLLPESFETYQVVQAGDIVWRLTDLQNDKRSLRTAIVGEVGIITSAYLATAPKAVSPRFLNYLLRAYDVTKVFYSMGGGLRQSMKFSDVRRLPIILPSVPEQSAIVAFLDRETAKIDALAGEQRRLIELLQEERQAVISHAVTKGLDLDASMKPSNIEWLGDVPAHWKVSALKRLARAGAGTFIDGDWIETPYITSEGIRLIQTGNIGIGHYREQGYRYVSDETFENLHCTEVKPGDVLICRLDGPVGRACLAPDLGARMITSVDNVILKVAGDVVPQFVVALLSSVPWLSWIDALCRVGGGFRLRVSRTQLGELRVPVPPLDEQFAIAEYLGSRLTKWNDLVAEAERAINLLQERRTALISAAVTGKIDVRDAVRKEAAAA